VAEPPLQARSAFRRIRRPARIGCVRPKLSGNDADHDEVNAAPKPSTIDDYLAGLPEDRRDVLAELRATIRAVVSEAEECTSYRMPAFRVNGIVVAGFRSTAIGFSYYPFSGATLRSLARDVSRYDQTKGSLHF
jgi:uncharacterized protein YdhG (YjbR/CyaY superfamily)